MKTLSEEQCINLKKCWIQTASISLDDIICILDIDVNDEFLIDLLKANVDGFYDMLYYPTYPEDGIDYSDFFDFFIKCLDNVVYSKESSLGICLPYWFIQKYPEKCAFEFAEGDKDLEEVLTGLFKNHVQTVACCAGHENGGFFVSEPYICLNYTNENQMFLEHILNSIDETCFKEISFTKSFLNGRSSLKIFLKPLCDNRNSIRDGFQEVVKALKLCLNEESYLTSINKLFYEICRCSSTLDNINIIVVPDYPFAEIRTIMNISEELEEYFSLLSLDLYGEIKDVEHYSSFTSGCGVIKKEVSKITSLMKKYNDNMGLTLSNSFYLKRLESERKSRLCNETQILGPIIEVDKDLTTVKELLPNLTCPYIHVYSMLYSRGTRCIDIYDKRLVGRFYFHDGFEFDVKTIPILLESIHNDFSFDHSSFFIDDVYREVNDQNDIYLEISGINKKYLSEFVSPEKKLKLQ